MRVEGPDARVPLIVALICLFDALWFGITLKRAYPPLADVAPCYGLLAWLCLGLAVSAGRPETPGAAFGYGAAVGALIYGTFNGTEAAIRPDWRDARVMALDIGWGAVVCGLASLLSHSLLVATSPSFTLVLGLIACLGAVAGAVGASVRR